LSDQYSREASSADHMKVMALPPASETFAVAVSYLIATGAPSTLTWRLSMKRYALPVVAALASALALGATSVSAQTYGGARSCAKDYKDFWETFDRQRYAKMSAEQIADLSRTALRGYDACTAGDERFTAENFFKKLDGLANAKASDIFKDGAFGPAGSPNAKKQ
jgi:hypothetical protein